MAGISGVRKSWHTLRHTFAKAYITSGGDVFSLRRVLGHSSLEMTMKYVDMQTEDLKAKHTQHARLLAGK
jgi:integrase/recombinase XerD